VSYKCTGLYTPSSEGGVRWNDPDLAVDWPFDDPILSGRDQNSGSLQDYLRAPAFQYGQRA
jgi:dTDP-4-dehydrorhamnose 3,5-epimerase